MVPNPGTGSRVNGTIYFHQPVVSIIIYFLRNLHVFVKYWDFSVSKPVKIIELNAFLLCLSDFWLQLWFSEHTSRYRTRPDKRRNENARATRARDWWHDTWLYVNGRSLQPSQSKTRVTLGPSGVRALYYIVYIFSWRRCKGVLISEYSKKNCFRSCIFWRKTFCLHVVKIKHSLSLMLPPKYSEVRVRLKSHGNQKSRTAFFLAELVT